ncbi:MAG: nuclear transport factor 2 family protein [Myxococcota bacterium]
MSAAEFDRVMHGVAQAWGAGEMEASLRFFHPGIVYYGVPHGEALGLEALSAYFACAPAPMALTWRHLAFAQATRVGLGEYTFEMAGRSYGVVVARLRDGRIDRWREYRVKSALSWPEFTGGHPF